MKYKLKPKSWRVEHYPSVYRHAHLACFKVSEDMKGTDSKKDIFTIRFTNGFITQAFREDLDLITEHDEWMCIARGQECYP